MIAALLVALAFGAGQAEARTVKVAHWQSSCVPRRARRCRRPHRLRAVRIVAPPPPAPPAPRPSPVPAPTPAPTPAPLPSRTAVDLTEWRVTPSYLELRAGEVEFNAANLGEDDHDFSVRDAAAARLATVDLGPGQSDTVRLALAAGVYTLYCSLPTHEEMGMRADVTVR
jgi:Copper binding proteins, plastocyanin/azurin family